MSAMLQDALDSFSDILSQPFRGVMAKSLALTIAVLVIGGYGLDRLALSFVHTPEGWISTTVSVLVGLGLVFGLVLLAAPTTSLVAGFYLDEIAGIVEREVDPSGPPGRPAPVIDSAMFALRFAALSLLVTLAALVLLFVPGLGLVAWLGANAYLLGREYFELAAMRFHSAAQARALRRRHAGFVFVYGVMIAVFVAIPLVNLLTPLFATTLMARLQKRIARAT